MGVFSITPRSKQLGNIQGGSVRRVNVPNYHIGSGSTEMWRAAGRLGRDIMSAGKDMAYIAGDMRREQRMIQDAETETAFVDAMRSKMEDPANGLLGRVRTAGNSEALQGCVTEGQDYFRTAAEELLKDKGYSGDRKQKMLMRLKEAASPFQRAMAHGVLAKTNELKVSAADRNFNTLLETWKSNMTDEDATRAAIDSYRASQRARGLSDDTVEINTDKILRGMVFDYAAHTIKKIQDEKGIEATIEKVEKNPSDILVFNKPLVQYFKSRNPFDQKEIEGLKSLLGERQREIIRNNCNAANLMLADGYSAASEIRDQDGNYPKDRVARIEKSIRAADDFAKTQPPGSKARTIAERGRVELDEAADKIATSEWQERLMNGDCVTRDEKTGVVTVSKPIGMIKGSREDRAFDAAKEKYMKAVEDAGNDLEKAHAKIWDGNKEILQRKLVSYYQAAAEPGEVGTRRAQEAYHELMSAWSEMSGGSLSPDFTLGFQKTVKEIDQKEIADGMRLFWSMLKGVEVLGPKDYNSRQASSSAPKFDKYGGLTDATVRRMDLGAEVAYDTGNPAEPFVMTVDEALQFSERVRNELANLDPKELQKSGVVRDVISRVYSNAAKKIVEKDIGKVQALSQTFGETIEELQTKMREPAARSLVEAVEDEKKTDEIRKRYEQK